MADEITQRTQELEGGLNQLEAQMATRATAPPAPPTQAPPDSTVELFTPAPPPAAPEPAAPADQPVIVPTWDEVSNDPDFQQQTAAEKASSFARWHDAAYNVAAALPDWEEHKDAFNKTAADEQARLLDAAGVKTLDEARARVAHEAILDKPLTTPDAERETLKELGPDIAGAYLRAKNGAIDESAPQNGWGPNTIINAALTFMPAMKIGFNIGEDIAAGVKPELRKDLDSTRSDSEKFSADAVKAALSTAAQTGLGLVKGVVRFTTPPMPPEAEKNQIGYDAMVNIHNSFKDFGDFVNTWREEVPKGLGVDPESTGTKVGEFAGGLAPYLLALPVAVIAHVGGAYGDTLDTTGSQTKAASAAAFAGVTDLLFMQLAKYTSGLGKGISDPVKRWATRIATGTAGNVSFQQLVKAGHAAIDAPADKRYEAFQTALKEMNWTDAGVQAAFAIHATKHAEAADALEVAARAAQPKPIEAANDALEVAAGAADKAGAPVSAAAARNVAATPVTPPAGDVGEAPKELVLGHSVDAEGKPVPFANIPDALPLEELQKAKDNLPPASPDGTSETDVSNRYFHQALDEAIARKQTEYAAPKEGAGAKEDPIFGESASLVAEAQRRIVGPALVDGGKLLLQGEAGKSTHADLIVEAIGGPHEDAVLRGVEHQFVDNEGNLLNRAEAMKVAREAGQVKDGVASENLHSQDLKPEPALESAAAVDRPVYTRRTPEEQKAKEDEGTQFIRDEVAQTGRVPKLSYIRGKVGNNADIARALHAELSAKIAEAHPAEAVPQGAEITTVKHPLTGDELPSVVEPADANGVRRTRPQFVNNPDILGQMIDQGMISGEKGNRLYIPDEIVDNDQINPSIAQHMKYDREQGQYYVDGVNTRHGFVDAPDQFTQRERESQQFTGRAHQEVSLPPDKLSALHEALRNDLDARGAAEDAITFHEEAEQADTDRIADERAVKSKGVGDPLLQLENVGKVDQLGLLRTKGDPKIDNPIQKGFDALLASPGTPEWMRLIAEVTKKAGFDLSSIKISLESVPNATWAGKHNRLTNTVRLNVAGRHAGGIESTFMHEAFHAILDGKLEPNAPRNPIEQRAYDLLSKLHDSVSKRLFQERFGHTPTDAELAKFQTAQGRAAAKGNIGREYYGLSDIREFVMESLTSPDFQRVLSSLEAKPLAAERPLFRNILNVIKENVKKIFASKEIRPTSALDHALNHALELLQQGPTEASRFDVLKQKVRPTSLTAEGRRQLAAANARAQQRAEASQETGMSRDELAAEIAGESAPAVLDTVRGDGWVTPEGKFVPIEERVNTAAFRIAGVEAPQFGGHEQAAFDYIQNNPKLAREFENTAESKGYQHINEMGIGDIKEFMESRGFLRAMLEGRNILFTGDPRRNPAGLKLLNDYAVESERALLHDRETSGPNGQRGWLAGRSGLKTLYRPPTLPETEVFAPVDEEPRAADVSYTRGVNGRRNLKIESGATRAQFESVDRLIDTDTGAPVAVKEALKEQVRIAERQLEPVVVQRVKIAGLKMKDGGANVIVGGVDAAENVARITAERKAEDIAREFGYRTEGEIKTKQTPKEQKLDRAAMPFVVEAAGDVAGLKTDLERVANSRDPKLRALYTGLVQHAIDNFDRLSSLKTHETAMQEQLQREQTFGIETPELKDYVTRILDAPDAPEGAVIAMQSQGQTRYFTKSRSFEKLSDAIEAGFKPVTTDIVDLDRQRIETGERIIQQKLLTEALKAVQTPDGKPIVSIEGSTPRATLYQGEQRITPRGYSVVNTRGGAPLIVHSDYAPLFKALYGERGNPNAIADWAGVAKRNTLILDTFHVGRITYKQLFYSGGMQRLGIQKGLSILENTKAGLAQMLKDGDISQKMHDYAIENYDDAQGLITNGLNVSKIADNLNAEHAASIPFIKGFNPWVFGKLSRGAMLQTALENLKRNERRFPELSRQEVLQRTVREQNELFGNLQKQSFFKDPRYQEMLRAIFLAPQWAESQVRTEARGIGQFGRAITDAAQGKFRLGTIAQGQLTAVIGTFAAMQVASMLLNGHTTFGNKKKDWFVLHIPGGRSGFEFNPLEIPAENMFMLYRYLSQHKDFPDALAQMVLNKLGPVSRGAFQFGLNRDFSGKQFENMGDRIRAAVTEAVVPGVVPSPIGVSAFLEKDPRQPLGYRLTRAPGAMEKSLLQSGGVKVSAALTPRGEMFALAHPYRDDKSYGDNSPSNYRELRSALDNSNESAVVSEIHLLADRGKTKAQILKAAGIGPGGTAKEKFTGKEDTEKLFIKGLSKDDREIYDQAQADHKASAQRLRKIMTTEIGRDKDLFELLRKNAAKPKAQLEE